MVELFIFSRLVTHPLFLGVLSTSSSSTLGTWLKVLSLGLSFTNRSEPFKCTNIIKVSKFFIRNLANETHKLVLALQVIQDFNSDINDTLTRINRKVSIWMISMSKKSGNMMPKLADITSMKYTNGRFGMKFRQILLSICNQATEGFPFCRSNFDLLSLSISCSRSLSLSLSLHLRLFFNLWSSSHCLCRDDFLLSANSSPTYSNEVQTEGGGGI